VAAPPVPSPQVQIPRAAASPVATTPAATPLAPRVGAAAGGCSSIIRLLTRTLTLGGQAAYADVIAPEPCAQGQIVSPTDQRPAPTPIEAGCFVWAVMWIFFGGMTWLVAGEWWGNPVFFVMMLMILFLLSLAGLRILAFSRLTLNGLVSLVTGRSRGTQNCLRFTLQTDKGPILVTMIGAVKNWTTNYLPQPGHFVRVWGIRSGNTARVWKLQFLNADYSEPPPDQIVTLSTARVVPLIAMLFFPSITWFVIWLVIVIVRAVLAR
jgi:hypothetical protein